jgi:N-acetylmuramoyl-L-alanine amidase
MPVCIYDKKRKHTIITPVITTVKPFVLVVDPGHGGKDLGATGNGLYEKDIALKIAEKIKALSTRYGVDVVLTRSNDIFMSPVEKSNFSNAQNADALISLHVNSVTSDNAANAGFEVLLSPDNEKLAAKNQSLGSAILQNISKNFNAASVLHQKKTGIWILKNSNIPSAMIECGYITDVNDARNLKDEAKIELMAKNILEGVAAYANNAVNAANVYQLQKKQPGIQRLRYNYNKKQRAFIYSKWKNRFRCRNKRDQSNNIESVTVLKDSAARAVYGAKGENG